MNQVFAINIDGLDRVLYHQGIIVEVNDTPFETDNLTSAQSVECTQLDWKLKIRFSHQVKQLVYFMTVIETANEAFLPGPFNLADRIYRDQIYLCRYSIFNVRYCNCILIITIIWYKWLSIFREFRNNLIMIRRKFDYHACFVDEMCTKIKLS
jgi:hypothetical protein